jgi:RNA recognition motif-containing protein
MKIFVSNLSFAATEDDVKALFEGLGEVSSVVIQREKKEAKSRGFGFVDMPDDQQAQAAIASLNDKEFMGRPLIVNPARIKTEQGSPGIKKEPGQAESAAGTPSYRSESRTDRLQIRTWHDASFPARKTSERSNGRRDSGPSQPLPRGPQSVKPFGKSSGDSSPLRKPDGDARPWKKPAGPPRP